MSETGGRHRVLVVGGGSIGERHARCFLATGRVRVSLCELNPALRERLTAEYPLEATFGDYEEALAQPWDAVVLATPAHLHVPQALAAAERGLALFIEKPLSTTLRGLDHLRALVRERGLIANVAYVYRAHPAVAAAQELIQDARIGAVHQVTVASGQHFPTFRPAYREIYYRDHATGGGAIQDALTHLFNAVQHLAGPFGWIYADYARQSLEGVTVEDTVGAVARLDGGRVLATFSLNQFMAPNETRIEIHGEGGSARLDLHAHRWGLWLRGESGWTDSPPLVRERDELFTRQAALFLDALEGRAPVLCPLSEAEDTLRANLATLYSGALRRPVSLAEVDDTFDPTTLDYRRAIGRSAR